MLSKFKNPVTLKAFAKTALVTGLCFGGSYYAWNHSDLSRKYHDGYPDGIVESYVGGFSEINWGPFNVNTSARLKKEFAPDGIQEIQTDLETINLKIKTDATDNIVHVSWYGSKAKNKNEELSITNENGVLRVVAPNKAAIRHDKYYGDSGVEIILPLSLVCKNGETKNGKDLVGRKTYSYSMSLADCGKLRLTTKSTKGDIHLGGTAFKSIDVETVSGDVRIESVEIHNTKIRTVSGDVLMNVSGAADIETVSGDVDVTSFESHPNPTTRIKTISGDAALEFYDNTDLSMTINYKTHTGDAKWNDEKRLSDGLTRVVGQGEGAVNIDTVSGDLKVRTKQLDEANFIRKEVKAEETKKSP